jgi:hypothetical protein
MITNRKIIKCEFFWDKYRNKWTLENRDSDNTNTFWIPYSKNLPKSKKILVEFQIVRTVKKVDK